MSEDLTETLVWDLTDRTQESNEMWEVGQTFFLGQQVILSVRWQPGQEISYRLRSWLRGDNQTMATLLWTRSSWMMSTAQHSPRTPHQTPPPPLPPLQPSETATSRMISVTGVPWGRSSSGREVRDLRRTGQTDLARTGWALKKVRLGCDVACTYLLCQVTSSWPREGTERTR